MSNSARSTKRAGRLIAAVLVPALCGIAQSPPDRAIALLRPGEMSGADRQIAEDAQAAIADAARLYGYALDSSYSYREIDCPVAPRHLTLAYEATQPNGTVSRFTAVVRRDAVATAAASPPAIQILPILHSGVVPFLPARSNPHTLEVFNQAIPPALPDKAASSNHRLAEDPLLLRSLCYLAMIGEPPAILLNPSIQAATLHAPVPTLEFLEQGKTRQVVSVRSGDRYEVWSLTFSDRGRLLAAQSEERAIDSAAPVLTAAESSPAETRPQPAPMAVSTVHAAAPQAVTAAAAATGSVRAALPDPPRHFIATAPSPPARLTPDAAMPEPPAALPK